MFDAPLKTKLNILQCSAVYHKHFSKFDVTRIVAGFGNKSKLIELKTDDDTVKFGSNGIEVMQFPCAMCSKEVDDTNGTSGKGLRCEGCWENFHNQCADTPMSKELYEQLTNKTNGAPDFVKVYCQKCMITVDNCRKRMDDIAEELAEVKIALANIKEKTLVNQTSTTNSPP